MFLKKIRQSKPVSTNIIDGVSVNIENFFGDTYKNLYNSANDEISTMDAYEAICDNVHGGSLCDVELVTPELVKEAVSKLKDDKSDAVFSYSTDCFKHCIVVIQL